MEILYYDKDIVVPVKPVGVLSEEGTGTDDSVPALLRAEFGTLYPVHRLDRAVGGVMVYARHKKAAAALCAAVAANALKKEYIAVVEGCPTPPEGKLVDLLFKDARQNKSFVVDTPRAGAREARLTYRTLATVTAEGGTYSRVGITLETGRSHQIRVQFASRKTPLVGDGKYGARTKAPAPALFSSALTFVHPTSKETVSFTAPTPDGFPWSLFGAAQLEIEHKYLIRMPDTALLMAQPHCRKLSITQTYLEAPTGETHRVRRAAEGDSVTLFETRKRRVSALSAVEEERVLTAAEYEVLLGRADPTRRPVEKTRYKFPFAGHTVEIDVYPFWQDRAVLEVEIAREDEEILLPPFVTVLREVTADKSYKNVNLAKSVPMDDISTFLS